MNPGHKETFFSLLLFSVAAAGFLFPYSETRHSAGESPLRDPVFLPSPTGVFLRLDDPPAPQITVQVRGQAVSMPLEEYVFLCTASEMPASYPEEALCAQAVCARTLAAFKIAQGADHGQGEPVCDSSSHCQAFRTREELRTLWGDRYDTYAEQIQNACSKTRGQILVFEDKPIEVFYHASSNGMTEDASEVFAYGQSYLTSVPSMESPEETVSEFSLHECAEKLNRKLSANFSESDILTMKISGRTASHRVESLCIAGIDVSGVSFRHALGLRSADFTWEYHGNSIVFTSIGFGHGVGMSQKGARAMADAGYDFSSILAHYYPGTELAQSDFPE